MEVFLKEFKWNPFHHWHMPWMVHRFKMLMAMPNFLHLREKKGWEVQMADYQLVCWKAWRAKGSTYHLLRVTTVRSLFSSVGHTGSVTLSQKDSPMAWVHLLPHHLGPLGQFSPHGTESGITFPCLAPCILQAVYCSSKMKFLLDRWKPVRFLHVVRRLYKSVPRCEEQNLYKKWRVWASVQNYSGRGCEMLLYNVTLHYCGVFMTHHRDNLSHALWFDP